MTTTNDGGTVHPMVMKAARVKCRRDASKNRIEEERLWRVFGPEFIEDAQAALTECGALECLEALDPETIEAVAGEINSGEHNARAASLHGVAKRQAAAIAKARDVSSADKAYGRAPE